LDWFTPNRVKAAHFAGRDSSSAKEISHAEMATSILARGFNGVLFEMDSQGVYFVSRALLGQRVPEFDMKAVDTSANGDGFTAPW
jgi:sugar/nucleoside kinase (ribokinase family)